MDSNDSSYSSGTDSTPTNSLSGSIIIKASIISRIERKETSQINGPQEVPCGSFEGNLLKKASAISRTDSKESSYVSGIKETPSSSLEAFSLLNKTTLKSSKECKSSSHSSGSVNSPCGSLKGDRPASGSQPEKDPQVWTGSENGPSYHGNLLRKLRGRADDKPFICPKCERCFSQMEHLVFHSRIHEGNREHSCSECEKIYGGKPTSVLSL